LRPDIYATRSLGIVPAVDIEALERPGAVAVLGPGASSEEVVAAV
jgi:hypothetical protein